MAKGIKKVLGVVAAVAIPFVAPAIAGAIGVSSALGTAAVGAGLGAAASAATGGNPLLGALTGGVGTFAASGGLQNMFGGAQTLPGQTSVGGGLFGGPGMTTGTPLYAQQGYLQGGAQALLPPGAGAAGAAGAAAGLLPPSGFLETGGAGAAAGGGGTALRSGISALTDPSTLARITLLAASGDMTGLSAAEQELVNLRKQELQEIASTNRELFDQQVRAAQDFMQMAAQQAPNPQQAFAETKIATERQLAEQTRGLGAGEASLAQRRAAIRGTQTGATAAAAEEARGRGTQSSLMQAGLRALPTSAPEGYAGLALPMYEDLAERARQARADLTYGMTRAAPNLFGGIA
jgi:hypothetical protein